MWQYIQATGELLHNWQKIAFCYSGFGEGRNNPEMQEVHDVGPIPVGLWRIGKPFDSSEHGPHCLPLTPEKETETFGRDGFLIHGDSKEHPGKASKGCIVASLLARKQVSASGDELLRVIAEEVPGE